MYVASSVTAADASAGLDVAHGRVGGRAVLQVARPRAEYGRVLGLVEIVAVGTQVDVGGRPSYSSVTRPAA